MAGKITFYKNIIDNMQEGVMTLDLEGHITIINDAAVTMLGVHKKDVIGKPFGQIFMVEMDGNDDFTQAILDAVYTAEVNSRSRVLFTRTDNTKINLSMSTAYLRDEGDDGHYGVIIGFTDISSIVLYQENEEKLNRELTQAVVRAEEANIHLERALKKVQFIRLGVTLLIIIGFAGGGYYFWNKDLIPQTLVENKEKTIEMEGFYAVVSRPISSSVSLSGSVAPKEELTIVAPFEGKVKKKLFHYDQRVEKGALLLTMDTSQLEKEMRDVQSKFIQAEQKYQDLLNWDKGTEVAKAKRSFARAKTALANARKKVDVSERLFQKDIIAGSELDSAKTAFFNQSLDFTAVQEELDVVKGKGDALYLDLAKLEFDNARIAFKEVSRKLKDASVYSPVAGVILRPRSEKGGAKDNIDAGTSLNQGEKLFSVGDLTGFSINAKADQVDIGKIRVGQDVVVRGAAFLDTALNGRVSHVSSNAVGVNMGKPEFDVIISISNPSMEQKETIRIGMTANVDVSVYNNPLAILVPLKAVMIKGNKKWVTVKNPTDGTFKAIEVKTGMTTLDSVEILDGLSPNDKVYY